MEAAKPEDAVMAIVRSRFEESGMSLHELGLKMGYPEGTARKSAWQFIRQTVDPRLSMLRRFAKATGSDLGDLLGIHESRSPAA
jgi:hypothetical protein